MRSGEKQMRGESTLTCGEDMDECGDRPLAGEKISWSCSSHDEPGSNRCEDEYPAAGVTVDPEEATDEDAWALMTRGVG